jgi:hypothetical protein
MVRTREIREILAAQANRLNRPEASQAQDGGLTRNDQVRGLLDLAEQLQGILVPVEPDASFRRRLHGDLILEAQRRQAEPHGSLFQQHRRGILIGAAAVGSLASIIGVIVAFVLRYRHSRVTPMATS